MDEQRQIYYTQKTPLTFARICEASLSHHNLCMRVSAHTYMYHVFSC